MGKPTDRIRHEILKAALAIVPFQGWTSSMLSKAEREAGHAKGTASLYFPDGVFDVMAFWAAQLDAQAEDKIKALDLPGMKIRDKVTAGVLARLEVIGPHKEAARRMSARLSLPDALPKGVSYTWNAADMIWRAIGDTSTDGNFYSKRTILSGVIATTLPVWLSDEEKGREFLDARIANVMQFEKLKWQVKSKTDGLPQLGEILGSLRYGGGFKRRRRRHSRML